MTALSGVWTSVGDGVQRTPGEYIPDPGAGYIELPFGDEPAAEGDGETVPEVEGQVEPAAQPQAAGGPVGFERRGMNAVVVAAALVAVLVVAGSVAILLRQRGRF